MPEHRLGLRTDLASSDWLLVEAQVPRVLRLQRLGHKRKDIDDFSLRPRHPHHAREDVTALQQRWHHSGGQGVAQILDPGPDAA
jgi:hypothetical protein